MEKQRKQEQEEEYEKWKRKGRICDRIGWKDRDNKNKKKNMKSGWDKEKCMKKNRQRKKANDDMKEIWHCKGRIKRKKEDKEWNISRSRGDCVKKHDTASRRKRI
jgi:hypothetical protein